MAHGKGSGSVKSTHFSNSSRTYASSIGVFLTGSTYNGKHGFSLKLRGLEPQFNGKAFKRAIVFHQAWYVSDEFVKKHGYVGRSWGCFALSKTVSRQVIQTIKSGTVVFAYYPDQKWLHSSEFLRPTSFLG